MDLKRFTEELFEYFKEHEEEGENFELSEAVRNNSTKKMMITFSRSGDSDRDVSPIIYPNLFYQHYLRNGNFEETAEDALQYARHYMNNSGFEQGFPDLGDFEKLKDKVIFKLVNAEKNKDILEQIPHFNVLDLAVTYRILLTSSTGQVGTVLVNNDMFSEWDVSEEELKEYARENTMRLLPAEVLNLPEALKQSGIIPLEDTSDRLHMYLISNKFRVNGAISVLYNGVLKDIATRIGSNLYILPSSTHEVVVVSAKDDHDLKHLKEMVCSINEQDVEDEDFLSNEVYLYDMKKDMIGIAV